jgi:adenylylsulfate kinase
MKASQHGAVIWLTGLSGSGKTTISHLLAQELKKLDVRVEILDGDIIRQQLANELGFSKQDRHENIRQIGFVAQLLSRNGVVVIVAAISPYREMRAEVRRMTNNFIEVFVNAPLALCEQRDVKGLYQKARAGKLQNFTGVSDPYEVPLNPELECNTDRESVLESCTKILFKLKSLKNVIGDRSIQLIDCQADCRSIEPVFN